MNIKIGVVIILFLSIFHLHAQEVKMTDGEITKFKNSLAKNAKMTTLSADFVQYKKVGFVKKEVLSSGKFYIKNPDKLAWFYSSPVKYSMVFKDKKIYMQEKGKTKSMDLGRSKQFEKISQAIQSNTTIAASTDKEFQSDYYQTASSNILKLNPVGKDAKKAMKQIVLYFDKATQALSEIKMMDTSNGYTRFVLSNQKVNGSLSDHIFNL